MLEHLGSDTQQFKRQPFYLGRLKCRRDGKREEFNRARFNIGMNAQFVSFREFARDAVQVLV